MKLSLIIPVYKVEEYIEKCINSCIYQNVSKDDYEIIAVNDGSPDNCGLILERLKSKYPCIQIINQENQGLSAARNTGLKHASGEYIWFIDSDDYIENDCLQDILIKLDKNKPDLLHINAHRVWNNRDYTELYMNYSSLLYSSISSGKENLKQKNYPVAAQMTIYKRDFLISNNLTFIPKILHEDLEFKPRAVYLAKTVAWHEPIVYNFLQDRDGSITSRFSLKNAEGFAKVMENLHTFKDNIVSEDDCKISFNELIGLAMNSYLNGLTNLTGEEHLFAMNNLKKFNRYFKDMCRSGNYKYMLEGYFFLFNHKVAYKSYGFIRDFIKSAL